MSWNSDFGSRADRQRGGGRGGWSQPQPQPRGAGRGGRLSAGDWSDSWGGRGARAGRDSGGVAFNDADDPAGAGIGTQVFYNTYRSRGSDGFGRRGRGNGSGGRGRNSGAASLAAAQSTSIQPLMPGPPSSSNSRRGGWGGGEVDSGVDRGGSGDGAIGEVPSRGEVGTGRRRRNRRRRGRGRGGGLGGGLFGPTFSPSLDSLSDFGEADMVHYLHPLSPPLFMDRFIRIWDNLNDDEAMAGLEHDVILQMVDLDDDAEDDDFDDEQEEELEDARIYAGWGGGGRRAGEETLGFSLPRGARDARKPPQPPSSSSGAAAATEAGAGASASSEAATAAAAEAGSHQPLNLPSCPVCLDTLEAFPAGKKHLMATFCGHLFCSHCIGRVEQLARSKGRPTFPCPVCQTNLRPGFSHHSIFWG